MEILSLGEKIKTRRKQLGMTLKDLAGDRITPGQISLVESGKSNPSMDLLEYLASTLSTSVEYLMETEETQAEKICTYYENTAEAYILNDEYEKAEGYLEKAMYYAENYKIEYRKAEILYLHGCINMNKKELGLAQQYFLSSNVIFIKLNCHEQIVNTFIKLGKIALCLKAYNSSCSYFEQAEQVFNSNNISNDFLIGEIYYSMAMIYFRMDYIDKSINYCMLAKEKFNQLENKKEYAKTLILLSKQYSEKGDLDNAIMYSKKSLKVFKENDQNIFIGEIENNLGKLFAEFENMEESFEHLKRAKEIRSKIKGHALIETLSNICENYIKLKDTQNSQKVLDEIGEAVDSSNPSDMLKYYMLIYRVNLMNKNYSEAENILSIALNYAENMELDKEAAEISLIMGKHYIDNCNDVEAAKYLNKGMEKLIKIGILKDL
ncbi:MULTISPECIES: helix-turn-helix domain-containing protein [Clostridium]|uniref:helix-turn-helix domain-containing protein n=1 Tax=Clostridium TaxID=1485 RepID=UPI00069D0EB0|nr:MULTISPECIES: helix-turn-helix domain-containing protein [Clostridium]KOF57421.1 XRE family transcriptional regulator [Clostridium sp. DMHC 10]MCD2347349.1 helix-turn-helix domain-containing protein [Clostridium guangxiense]